MASPQDLLEAHGAEGFSSLLEADREGGRSGSDVELPGISPQSARELGGRRRRGFMAAIFASAACGALALAASSQSHPDGLRFAGGAFAAFAAAGAANASVVANVSATASVSAISQADKVCSTIFADSRECCWTQSWSCSDQPVGSKGAAIDDGTIAYHCCCKKQLWKSRMGCEAGHVIPWPGESNATSTLNETVTSCDPKSMANATAKQQEAVPEQCNIHPAQYAATESIQQQCKMSAHWQALVRNVKPKNCQIDPETKMMRCERDEKCAGGRHTKQDLVTLTKKIVYDCKASCEGPLLIDCCNACLQAKRDAQQWGVDEIICGGCKSTEMKAVAQAANCKLEHGKFSCASKAHCEVGQPSEACAKEHRECHIYPCSGCQAPHLKAQCCAKCLARLCDKSVGERMVCEGCSDSPGTGQWWSSLPHIR